MFNETETLPLYRLYNHKIKLFPGQISFYNKARIILPKKFLTVRKYINNYLIKRFIRINTFLITAFILFIKKLKKGIYIYVNYKDLNNITVKNRYLILLIRKILNVFYLAKIYIKLNVITAFNRLRIVFGNK